MWLPVSLKSDRGIQDNLYGHLPAPYKSTYSRHIYTTKEPVNTIKHFEVSQLITPEQNWPTSWHRTNLMEIDWRKLFTFCYVYSLKHHWATITNNSPSQNYSHPNDHTTPSKAVKQEQFTVANICLSENKLSVTGFKKNAKHHWRTYKLLIWSKLSGVTRGEICSICILEHFFLHHHETFVSMSGGHRSLCWTDNTTAVYSDASYQLQRSSICFFNTVGLVSSSMWTLPLDINCNKCGQTSRVVVVKIQTCCYIKAGASAYYLLLVSSWCFGWVSLHQFLYFRHCICCFHAYFSSYLGHLLR